MYHTRENTVFTLNVLTVVREQTVLPKADTCSVLSDQSLHCLPCSQHFLDISAGSQMDLFKFYDKYSNEFRCENIEGKYDNMVTELASVAQSDVRPTGDQEVAGSIPARSGNIHSWRLIMKYFLWSFSPFH